MIIPFAPILTLCVLLQSLLLQSLDYQVASNAFHLGGYFLLGSNTAYILTGRMTLLDGLLDIRYIEPPVTPYPKSPLLQTSPVPRPMQISSRAWAEAIPTSAPSYIIQASATTVPTVADVSPTTFRHLPPPEFKSPQGVHEANPSVIEPPSPVYKLIPSVTLANVTSVDGHSNDSQSVTKDDWASGSHSLPSLRSLIARILDSQNVGLIALVISAFFGLLTLGICLHIIHRPLALQPRSDSVERTRCGHEEMIQNVRLLLDHLGADKDVSLAEFCRSFQVLDISPSSNTLTPASPNFGMSSSYATLAQSPLAHRSTVRQRIPLFNALPTPDPSGAGQQNAQSRSGPHVASTGDSQLADSFAFYPPAASSPVRMIYRAASTVSAALSLGKSMSRPSFRLPRSTAPDVIDRMNENRSLLFDDLFGRLDKLGEDSPERSTRFSDEARASPTSPLESNTFGSSSRYRTSTPNPGSQRAIGARFLKSIKMRDDVSSMESVSSQAKNDSDKRSIALQATPAEQETTLEDDFKLLQHKPFMAHLTSKLQQWSWIPAWVACVAVLLMAVGVVPVASAPLLALS